MQSSSKQQSLNLQNQKHQFGFSFKFIWIINDHQRSITVYSHQYVVFIMIMQSKGQQTFASLPKGEQYKDELQGFYHQPSAEQQLKKVKKYQREPSSNCNTILLIFISLLFFALIVLAVNFYFSQQVFTLINSKSESNPSNQPLLKASQTNQQLQKKLKDIESNELKIMAKLSEMAKKIDKLDQQPVNIVDSDSPTNQQQASGAATLLKAEIEAISKELKVIQYDLATTNKKLEKDSAYSSSELTSLKEFIIKDIQLNQKASPRTSQPTPAQKIKDDREFEADFVTESIEDEKQERFTKDSENYVNDKYIFNIPKKLWMYTSAPGKSYMNQLTQINNIHFAKLSNYEVFIVNRTNFKTYMSLKSGQNVQKFISFLQKRTEGNDPTNLKYHLQSIIKKFVLLSLLNENGGLMSNGEFAMTEDLSWINNIFKNPYPNRGNRGIKPQVVGFYSHDYSFQKTIQNIKPFPGMNNVDKYITVFPALQDYFIAAEKNTLFLTKLIAKIMKLLKDPLQFKRERGHYKLKNLKGVDIYYEYFLIAVQTVLQDKQKEIDLANIDKYRHFALDYYGLYLINCFYAPYKLKSFWGNGQSKKAFESLSQYTVEELYANIGPMRYIARITPVDEMNSYLEDTRNIKKKLIMEGSFIQKIFFPNVTAFPFVRKNEQIPFINKTNEPWLSLPKIIWVFWDKGLANAAVNNQICVQNLRRMGKLSGFVVNEVNLSNINTYLDQKTLEKIKNSLNNAKLRIYPQSQGDLYRLALLAKYGGIYMDASFLALQSLDWLINIGKYPSQYIFNRFGNLPKVFMMWHPHYGSPLEWVINSKYGVKSQWHLAYENNFIAAQKGSDLIIEWFELLLQLYLKPYNEVEEIFQDCIMYSHKWSTNNWHYLIPMDTIKCVIGRKQVNLLKQNNKLYASASDYYKIWSISGYLGQQKLRSNTNFENPGSEDNVFVYRYSQDYVEGLVGKIRHLTKFYSQHNKELTLFVSKNMDGNFSNDAHPDSIFMRHMWQQNFKLEEVNFYPRLKVVS